MKRLLLVVWLLLVGVPAFAGALRPGDFVMVTRFAVGPGYRIVALDGASLAATEIATYGYIGSPADIVVTRQGMILITSPAWGIVRIDPATGQQTLIAPLDSLGGGSLTGLTVAAGGEIYISMQGAAPRIVRLSASGSVQGVVTSGGLLTAPEGLAFGPDSALYVCETQSPVVTQEARGSLVRVDPVSGAQTQIAAGPPLYRPHDLAAAPDGSLWSIGYGLYNGHLRYAVRTSLTDGASAVMVGGIVNGIAIRPDGVTVLGKCTYEVSGSCQGVHTCVHPSGPCLLDFVGPLAYVPDIVTTATTATWGRIKALYR